MLEKLYLLNYHAGCFLFGVKGTVNGHLNFRLIPVRVLRGMDPNLGSSCFLRYFSYHASPCSNDLGDYLEGNQHGQGVILVVLL